jgi:hypothetical protein
MHRQIMGVKVDHLDLNGLNNQRSNLRPCTEAENRQHLPIAQNNRSGHRGVCWHKGAKKWRAQAQLNGRQHYLGLFVNAKDADIAIKAWRKEHMPFAID